jgi:hypothetical protein
MGRSKQTETHNAQETLWKLPDFMPVSLDVMQSSPERLDNFMDRLDLIEPIRSDATVPLSSGFSINAVRGCIMLI